MKLMRIAVMAALAVGVAGCELNEQSFKENRTGLRQHPEQQAKYLAWCENKVKYEHIELKRHLAGFMHTGMEGLPKKVCSRMLRGYLSGRMRYEDLSALARRQKFTPNMVAILRAG